LPFNTLGRVVALAAVLVGLLIAGAGTAHAAWSGSEQFGPNAPVTFGAGGTGSGQLVVNTSTGTGHARLSTKNAGSWSAVERKFSKPAIDDFCNASVYVNAGQATRKVNLEVIDPATWRYISLKQVQVSGYQKISFPPNFKWAGTNMILRVALVNSGSPTTETLDVDDLSVGCFYVY
jgi:hypothetical protein